MLMLKQALDRALGFCFNCLEHIVVMACSACLEVIVSKAFGMGCMHLNVETCNM